MFGNLFSAYFGIYNFSSRDKLSVLVPPIYTWSFFHNMFFLSLIFSLICHIYRSIVIVGRVFANGPGDRDSIPSRVIQKAKKKTT